MQKQGGAGKARRVAQVDIVLVKYGQPGYERECIESVLANTEEPYNLVVVDNFSADGNLSAVWNRCVRKAHSDTVCLLNTDTVCHPGWLEPLIRSLDEAHIVGPVTNRCGTPQRSMGRTKSYSLSDCDISGFCMAFRKSTWRRLGGFDEDFRLYGEDSDFCQRARELGMRTACQRQSYVYHYGGKSSEGLDQERVEEVKAESRRLLRDKNRRRRGGNGKSRGDTLGD